MTRPNVRAKVGTLNMGKSKKKENKGVKAGDSSGIWMKLKILFSCIIFGFKPKGSSKQDNDNYGKDGSKSSAHDNNGRDQVASPNTNNSSTLVAQSSTTNNNTHFHNFSYNDLKLATRNFRRENFLGEGEFGSVFKGWLCKEDEIYSPTKPGIGIPIAVKILNLNGLQEHTEWLDELKYLSQLQHPKLAKLIGFCVEGDKRLLAYEFMSRGRLDLHLFRRFVHFPWSTRMRIMLDAAEGLAYLHQDDDNKKAVIFRDFKTSNILLDKEYNAKLFDFGLVKNDTAMRGRIHMSTAMMSRQGYAAPEYVMTGYVTTMSDVYSFGVVLLEVITGKRVIDKHRPLGEANFVPWVVQQIENGGSLSHMILLDSRLNGIYSRQGALKALKLAAKCVSHNPSARPQMSEVVTEMMLLATMVDDMGS